MNEKQDNSFTSLMSQKAIKLLYNHLVRNNLEYTFKNLVSEWNIKFDLLVDNILYGPKES